LDPIFDIFLDGAKKSDNSLTDTQALMGNWPQGRVELPHKKNGVTHLIGNFEKNL